MEDELLKHWLCSLTDPGFPKTVRGCTNNPQMWGHQPIIFAILSWKVHEILKSGTERGHAFLVPHSLDLAMV